MIYDDLLPGSGWLNRTTSTQGSFQVSEFIYAPLDRFDHLRWLQSQDNHDNPATSFLQCNMIGCLPRFHLLAEINWSLHHVGSISDFRFHDFCVLEMCSYLATCHVRSPAPAVPRPPQKDSIFQLKMILQPTVNITSDPIHQGVGGVAKHSQGVRWN